MVSNHEQKPANAYTATRMPIASITTMQESL